VTIFGILCVVTFLIGVLMIRHFYNMKMILSQKNQKPRAEDHGWYGMGIAMIFLSFILGSIELLL